MANKNGNGKSLEFSTSDLYFAAYLQTAGAPLLRADRSPDNGGKVQFVFDTSIVNIEELKSAWFSSTGKVAANPFAYSIRALKSLVHMR